MPELKVHDIAVEVVRKNIKNMHLAVYPPNGRVRVAVPMRISDDAVRVAVISRLGWIRRQQKKLRGQDRQSPREFISRESHYFLGRRYLLNIIPYEGRPRIVISRGSAIDFYLPEGTSRLKREKFLQEWYRKELKALIPPLIEKWEPVISVKVSDWGVKKMKTRWGSCNKKARRIWMNLELAKKPVECLEYVVVHELVHFHERKHNENFIAHMDKVLPQWKSLRNRLNSFPLRHEKWGY